jgi:membrane protease subunit HflC
MKRNTLTLVIGGLLGLIFLALVLTYQVRISEVAVITTFGKPTEQISEPGHYRPYLKWPWPIQQVHKFDQRVQNFEDKLSEGLTRDSFNLLTSVYVGWKITNAMSFYPKFAGSAEPIAEAEKSLGLLLRSAKSAVVGKHPLSDFVSASAEASKFVPIEEEILDSLRGQIRTNNYGIEIEFLGIKRIGLPENVTQAVFDRMTSERKVLADKLQYEGETEANNIRSDAERRAAELLADADAKAIEIRGKGEAEAAKYLSVFQQKPELANYIFRLNALEGSLKERSTLIFDQRTPPFDLFTGVSTNLMTK